MFHGWLMAQSSLLTVLDDAVKGLLGVADLRVSDGVVGIVGAIDKQAQTHEVALVVERRRVECPQIEGINILVG